MLRDLADAQVIKEISVKEHHGNSMFSVGDAMFTPIRRNISIVFAAHQTDDEYRRPKFVGLGMDELGYIIKPEFFAPAPLHAAKYPTGMSPGVEAEHNDEGAGRTDRRQPINFK